MTANFDADIGQARQQIRGLRARASESELELLLVTRPNGNHSPGPVIKEVSP